MRFIWLPLADSQLQGQSMQNKQFTKVVIWIVVGAMVISMGIFSFVLFT